MQIRPHWRVVRLDPASVSDSMKFFIFRIQKDGFLFFSLDFRVKSALQCSSPMTTATVVGQTSQALARRCARASPQLCTATGTSEDLEEAHLISELVQACVVNLWSFASFPPTLSLISASFMLERWLSPPLDYMCDMGL